MTNCYSDMTFSILPFPVTRTVIPQHRLHTNASDPQITTPVTRMNTSWHRTLRHGMATCLWFNFEAQINPSTKRTH